MSSSSFPPKSDPERQLYDAFISNNDKKIMGKLRSSSPSALNSTAFQFKDKRLKEMLWRYKARNFPEVLSVDEKSQWFEFCSARIGKGDEGVQSVFQLNKRIEELKQERELNVEQLEVLKQLSAYGDDLKDKYRL